MSTSPGLLDFFILEAGEYVGRLDALLAAGGQSGPGPDDFLRLARALRGSATMNRQGTLAEVAGGIERVARALRDGTLVWEPTIAGVVTAAVDDLKLLLHGVRSWGPTEEQRAQGRIAELARWAPQTTRPYTPTPSFSSSAAFLVAESVAIADTLDAYVARPADRVALGVALGRVRALRGLAALRDLPPLPDVVEAVERAAKPIELGEGSPQRPQLEVFTSAARLLRRAASELRLGGNPDVGSPEAQAFAAAAGALADTSEEADRIVPIAELFFGDGQPDIVARAPNPPTTPAHRFRLEAVSQAEHLRRLVADARQAVSGLGRDRVARELRSALRALRSAAESFGEREVAAFVAAQENAVAAFDARALGAVDEIAAYLASPTADRGELARRLGELGAGRARTPAVGTPAAPRRTPTAAAAPASAAASTAAASPAPPAGRHGPERQRTPSGRQLHAILDSGITRLGALSATPLSEPAILDETVVPIESLLYRGRAALDRARELRDELRVAGSAPPPEVLSELYDLLELATTE